MCDGVVFNIQKYSIHDGPGIRTTVFLKGCPLDCSWCHNPESKSPDPQVHRTEARCVQCGQCVDACPQRSEAGTGIAGNSAECLLCGACVDVCPTEARQMVGRRMTVAEVMANVLQDQIFYDESGGGVTFSGGEPLMQPEFLRGLLSECRREGVHTAIDTCGFAPQQQLLNLAKLTDLVLYDVKALDERLHQQFTGSSNQIILDNLRALGSAHDNIWIRVPVVPGFNDNEKELTATARFVAEIPNVTQVNLLPYHALHRHKMSLAGRMNGPAAASDDSDARASQSATDLEKLAKLFRAENLKTVVGGHAADGGEARQP
jgi:pyruvate formate lyase activating enzyme